MAQQAQAVALIVYATDDIVPLPKMAGGDSTPLITIPGMLVTGTTGGRLLYYVQEWQKWYYPLVPNGQWQKLDNKDSNAVWMALRYSLLAPDDRVEYDLYTYPDEANAQSFLDEFQDISVALGKAALFTPHYRVIDGQSRGCYISGCTQSDADDMPCGTQCSSCGRYCRIDPNGNLNTKPDGFDVVVEITYAKALWNYGQNHNQPQLWWQYIKQRGPTALNCKSADSMTQCSKQAMQKIGLSQTRRATDFDRVVRLGKRERSRLGRVSPAQSERSAAISAVNHEILVTLQLIIFLYIIKTCCRKMIPRNPSLVLITPGSHAMIASPR